MLILAASVFVWSGGVRRSDGSHRVQQQRPEDQLHPEDPGEAPGRPQRGQRSKPQKDQSKTINVSMLHDPQGPLRGQRSTGSNGQMTEDPVLNWFTDDGQETRFAMQLTLRGVAGSPPGPDDLTAD